jgi:dihydroorotate dehydrogenase (NAD+) catalytic subunit
MDGMAIDPHTLRPALTGVSGGLSGPAIRPVAVRCVYQVHAALPSTPIIGVGGIATGLDALEFILAGASAVAVGTALFHDPAAATRVLRELDEALAARRIGRLADAVGLAHKPAGYVPPQVRPQEPEKEKL